MAFDIDVWKERARDRLTGWRPRMQQAGVNSIYAFVSAAALWPVVEAVRQDDWTAVAELGSVGSKLLANRIRQWKDEADAARQLEKLMNEDEVLRAELDAILTQLHAFTAAEAGLAEEERVWFEETLRQELAMLGNLGSFEAQLEGSGAIAQGTGAKAVGERGVIVEGGVEGSIFSGDDNVYMEGHMVFAEQGATVVIGEAPVKMTAVDRASALGDYLQHLISLNRYLQLQGIRSGGRLVHIELDRIYVTLRATTKQAVADDKDWLAFESEMAPGERYRMHDERAPTASTTIVVNVNEAMRSHKWLVVLGDPGSGKTTLLRYLTLLYSRDMAEGGELVMEKLGLDENGYLPLLMPLRKIGAFLKSQHGIEESVEGHGVLLDFIREVLRNERIEVPDDFFDKWLTKGRAVVMLDGMDEVADPDLRRRVARLVEAFTRKYPDCRYVVTSRIVGYEGGAQLGESYATTTVQEFTMADVEHFLRDWHRLIAIGQMGPVPGAEAIAAEQTEQLLQAIRSNERIRDLAINPLMLTVIAMVHRDRVKLPDRRAELYAEAVDVLLGKWDEARGVQELPILDDRPFDTGDKRLMLQSLALVMHETKQKELSAEELQSFLADMFYSILGDWRMAERAVERFLHMIRERTGLLVARGEGAYAFSHLTFQEYMSALAVAGKDDYIPYSLARSADSWWREVILLEAGHMSMLSKERTSRLIKAIVELTQEPALFHNLVLAGDCLRDVGAGRVEADIAVEINRRLSEGLAAKPPAWLRLLPAKMQMRQLIERRGAAVEAMVRVGGGYWSAPHGEPEWIEVRAGEFWMGDEEYQVIDLPDYHIARVPITNAQYHIFTKSTEYRSPEHWQDGRPPRDEESHPVVNVSWHDAMAYCRWLSKETRKPITLPTEAQWEKAARGERDKRVYPWGDTFDSAKCNSRRLGLGDTSPVGVFLEGASPYGCLDMSGNVWEWCLSKSEPYPYREDDGRNSINDGSDKMRVVRGGSFIDYSVSVHYGPFVDYAVLVHCAYRYGGHPHVRHHDIGFRVVFSPSTTEH